MNQITSNPYYIEGGLSYRRTKGRYKNPYPIHSEEFNLFERGWVQAQRRSYDIQAQLATKLGLNKLNAKKVDRSEVEKTKRAYKRRKG